MPLVSHASPATPSRIIQENLVTQLHLCSPCTTWAMAQVQHQHRMCPRELPVTALSGRHQHLSCPDDAPDPARCPTAWVHMGTVCQTCTASGALSGASLLLRPEPPGLLSFRMKGTACCFLNWKLMETNLEVSLKCFCSTCFFLVGWGGHYSLRQSH